MIYTEKPEGEVLDSCVVPASTYGLETVALSEQQQLLDNENSRCKENVEKINKNYPGTR